ncbi:HEAT repeat domain-containing protein [Saccharibacillus sp. O23]|uniref:HEAT repeat domain-containing protein n=1 Tax=Saccharibacillus sp. O23 TaxID=2009338 RepID=UPI0015C67453|nr:HEAT repeat domain-containing protein [Saccharibacillus sp. O23]
MEEASDRFSPEAQAAFERLLRMQKCEEAFDFAFVERCSHDSESLIRCEAAAALGIDRCGEGERILIRLTDDPNHLVRTEACESLAWYESEKVLRVLERKIRRDRSVMVRAYAVSVYGDVVQALGRSREEAAVFLESRLLRERSSWGRLAWAEVLYKFGRETYLNELLNGLELPDLSSRCMAGNGLREVVNVGNCRKIRTAALDWLGRESAASSVEIAVKLIETCIETEYGAKPQGGLIP